MTNDLLRYEVIPEPGDRLLVRMLGTGGSAWPWAGDEPEFHQTMWLVGRSERLQILAYGNRKHLTEIGSVPSEDEGKSTWWPSIPGGYEKLLNAAAKVVGEDVETRLEMSGASSELTMRSFIDYFFDKGVQRGDPLLPKGVYELLLRVDGVEEHSERRPIVYGSPLWVAKEPRAVPGTYMISDFPDIPGVTAVASWDGVSWSNMRLEDYREPFQILGQQEVHFPELPELPTEPPANSKTLYSLDLPEAASSRDRTAENRWRTLWRKLLRKK
jgi:hypothetical protein